MKRKTTGRITKAMYQEVVEALDAANRNLDEADKKNSQLKGESGGRLKEIRALRVDLESAKRAVEMLGSILRGVHEITKIVA